MFDGSGSADPDGTVVAWSWTFGDGASGSGAIVTHTYISQGPFTVTLTVTDNSGNTGMTTHAITIGPPVVTGHARLAHGKASPAFHHFVIGKDGTTQTFFAIGLNDGNVTVQAYVIFHVTGDGGVNNQTFTQVVPLAVGQLINGKTTSSFSSAYTITAIGSYSVTAEIFFNSNLSATCTPTTSSPVCTGFTGDTASEKTFSFAVVA